LPAAFYEMGTLGNFFSVLFFIALAFAGLTSAVSLVEPMVQYAIGRFSFSRLKASVTMGLFFYIVGILVILSGLDSTKDALTWGGKNLFDWIDFITAAVMLPMAGLVMSIFVGYVVPKNEVESVLKPHLKGYFAIWYFSLRYIAPAALLVVVANLLGFSV